MFWSWRLRWDSLIFQYPWLPDMKLFATQTQRSAAMQAGKQTESTEIVLDSTQRKKPHPPLKTTRAVLKHVSELRS